MVGRRHRHSQNAKKDGNNRRDGDLESGNNRGLADRFRDAANIRMADERRAELKRTLTQGFDCETWQKCRKSPEELGEIKNKKVRRFYEEQNARLNDWVEIDALVMAIGEDIIDSMNPDAGKLNKIPNLSKGVCTWLTSNRS